MDKIKNLAELRKMREGMQGKMSMRENSNSSEAIIQIKVGMATSGIASGAKETMNYLITEIDKRQIKALVMQVGDMVTAMPSLLSRSPFPARIPSCSAMSTSPAHRRSSTNTLSTASSSRAFCRQTTGQSNPNHPHERLWQLKCTFWYVVVQVAPHQEARRSLRNSTRS